MVKLGAFKKQGNAQGFKNEINKERLHSLSFTQKFLNTLKDLVKVTKLNVENV
jgi:hypothetical protein